jgi:PIN domain nuclease of toxin-antitoxin system
MRILLDTQCLLWMASAPERLSRHARTLVQRRDHHLYVSAASAWEIAIKYSVGKLRLPEPPARYVPACLDRLHIGALSIEPAHALHVATLPMHHRDPFDRVLIAQAQIENLPILTADDQFAAYDVTTIDA